MTIVINEAALDAVLHGAAGPVQRATFVEAENIKAHASTKIHRSEGPGPHLADSGIVEDTQVAGLPGFLVGFESEHALFYYEGTRPHRIEARNARVLAFRWPKVGPGMYFFRAISHPGTEPHPFLHDTVAEMFGAHLV